MKSAEMWGKFEEVSRRQQRKAAAAKAHRCPSCGRDVGACNCHPGDALEDVEHFERSYRPNGSLGALLFMASHCRCGRAPAYCVCEKGGVMRPTPVKDKVLGLGRRYLDENQCPDIDVEEELLHIDGRSFIQVGRNASHKVFLGFDAEDRLWYSSFAPDEPEAEASQLSDEELEAWVWPSDEELVRRHAEQADSAKLFAGDLYLGHY